MNTGETIKQCRHARGMTQQALSDKSGVSRQTISYAEINKSGTSVAVLVELLKAMDYGLVVVDMRGDNGE